MPTQENNKYFGAYVNSTGTQKGNLHQGKDEQVDLFYSVVPHRNRC